jgi:hypothetical protein
MWGRRKCSARAFAIVPLPLAAGPSTAITNPPAARFPDDGASFKRSALTAAKPYGKARAD